jgi:ketosteroid isomerase-like protein
VIVHDGIWDALHAHLATVFDGDSAGYADTVTTDLSLYEWFVTPHRQDGVDFHLFMIENGGAGIKGAWRYDLLNPRLQVYGEAAVASYTFMLTVKGPEGLKHQVHNESRVLVRQEGRWKVAHVHKSPAWNAPYAPA